MTAHPCTRAQLYNPKTSVGYNLGKVTVWPPTQPNEYLQMYSLCQVQVNLAIPAGEYNVRPHTSRLCPVHTRAMPPGPVQCRTSQPLLSRLAKCDMRASAP